MLKFEAFEVCSIQFDCPKAIVNKSFLYYEIGDDLRFEESTYSKNLSKNQH